MATIADLIMRQGEIAARGAERSGQIWGNAVSQLGKIGAGAFEQYSAEKKQKKREEAFSSAINAWDPADPKGSVLRLTSVVGPEDAMRFANGLTSLETTMRKNQQGEIPSIEDLKAGVTGAYVLSKHAPGMFAQQYPNIRQQYGPAFKARLGYELPETPTPEVMEGLTALAEQWGAKGGTEEYTLTPGAARFRGSEQIAAVPAVDAAPKVGSFEDYAIQKFGPRPTPQQIAQARREYAQADNSAAQPSFQAKEVLNDAGRPVMANFDGRSGRYIEVATGQPIANPRPVPSASETQDARKFKQATPILTAVSELSEKINTLQGVAAKAAGEIAKQKAKVNLDDNVAEYEALVQGFTPLVARALGHTGVLTQQDVDSVRTLFPKPGDSKSLRDRKVARMKGIIGELESGAGGTPPAPVAPAGSVSVTAPNGKTYTFPNQAQADVFKKRAGIK